MLVPSIVVAYVVYSAFLAWTLLFAQPGGRVGRPSTARHRRAVRVHAAARRLFIWVGIAISTRSSDVRVAQQLTLFGSIPAVSLTSLIAFDVIPPTSPARHRPRDRAPRRRRRRLADRRADVRPRAARHRDRADRIAARISRRFFRWADSFDTRRRATSSASDMKRRRSGTDGVSVPRGGLARTGCPRALTRCCPMGRGTRRCSVRCCRRGRHPWHRSSCPRCCSART